MATEQDYWNQMYANACDQNEVLSLRQQLADMTKERDKAKAMPMRYRRMEFNAQLQDENEALRQQLADHIKREVMLRDGLKRADDLLRTSYDHESPLIKEALAATADLEGLTPLTYGISACSGDTIGICGITVTHQ